MEEATPITFVIEPNEPAMVTVSTQLNEHQTSQRMGQLQNLLGNYTEIGECCGRKCFQKLKKSSAGKKATCVFLYFWYYYDGPDPGGWWFGSDVGGSEVWARAGSPDDSDPPRAGWRIPVDAEVKSGALFVDLYQTAVSRTDSSKEIAAEEILMTAMDEVQTLEAAAEACLSASREAGEEAWKGVYEKLLRQRSLSVEMHEVLNDHIVKSKTANPKALAVTAALAKLGPRVKAVEASLIREIYRVLRLLQHSERRRRGARVSDIENRQRQQQQSAEEKETKDFQAALPHSMDVVAAAEDAVEAVSLLAAPLLAELPEQEDLIEPSVAKIEDATRQAQRKLSSAMVEIANQLVIVGAYATRVKENAMSEYCALKERLQKAHKHVEAFQTFRQGFGARVAAKSRLLEMTDALSAAEVEVEKVIMASQGAGNGVIEREEAESAIMAMRAAGSGVSAVLLSVNSMLQGAVGIAKASFNEVNEHACDVQSKINTSLSKLNGQLEALQAQQLEKAANEEILKVESALKSCQDAELAHISMLEPFSEEGLAKVEHEAEVKNELASKVVCEAIGVLRTKLVEVHVFKSEAVKPAVMAISELLKKGEDAAAKVLQFKRNAQQSKVAAILKEVVEAVCHAEAAVAALAYASQIFLSGEFENVSLDVIRQASDSSSAAERQADMACAQAKRILFLKHRQLTACGGAPDLHQLQDRLAFVQQFLAKHHKLLVVAERAINCKQFLLEESQRLDDAEAATRRAEVASELKSDMDNDNLPPEHVDDLSTSLATAENLLKASAITCTMDGKMASASSMEGSIKRLKEQKQLIQERLCLVSTKTKRHREQRRCEHLVGDSIHKIECMEKLLEQVKRSQQSLIRNAETLSLPLAMAALLEFEAAAAETQTSIEHVQSSLAAKSRGFRHFACQKSVNAATMELDKLTGCVNAAAVKLEAFKTAVGDRRAAIQAQAVAHQVAVAESAVIQLDKAANKISKSDAVKADQCERLRKLAKAAQTQVDSARIALIDWSHDAQRCRLKMDTAEHLQLKLTTIAAKLAKSRKASHEQERAHMAVQIITEAKEWAAVVDEYVGKAKKACSPLVENEGEELLAYGSLKLFACALTDHAKAKGMTLFEVLKQSIPEQGENRISKECFAACLDTIAETIGHDELHSTMERKLAMFVNLDTDQDGSISLADLRDTFQVQNICMCNTPDSSKAPARCAVKKRPMLDRHAAGSNLGKDRGTSIECIQHMPRSSGRFRFVSVCKHGCRAQVEVFSPYNSCVARAEGSLEEASDGLCQTRDALKAKEADLAKLGRTGQAGALQRDLLRLQKKVIASLAVLSALRKKLEQSKDRVMKREQSEQIAYMEVRERRQAASFIGDVDIKLASLETCAQELSKAAHPITVLDTRAQLDAFSRLLDFWNNIEQRYEGLLQAAAEIRSLVAKRIASMTELNPQSGPLLDASVQLEQVETKVETLEAKAENSVAAVQSKCHALATAWSNKAVDAMRANLLRRGLTPEGLFQELAEGNDCIAEDVFFHHLVSLQELASVRHDHIQVLCWYWRVMDGGVGVSRRLFMSLVQRYMVVIKAIALTDAMDVATSSVVRIAKVDEVMEVLEAPTSSNSGLMRVCGRLLKDSRVGWITVRGSQGTCFLKEVYRPQFLCKQDTRLVQSSACDALETVRILKAGEVLDVLEGPATAACLPVKRVHGKACSDGAVGWFSTTDDMGGTLAELDNQTYVCTSAVALTDEQNLSDSSVLRKVEVGEVLEVLDGPLDIAGLIRIRGRLLKHGDEGWLTARGSAGKNYASASTRHYRIARNVPLHRGFKTTTDNSLCVRTLAEGELVEVLEPPKDGLVRPSTYLKVAPTVDGLAGWIRVSENVEKWSPACTCLHLSPLLYAPNNSAVVLQHVEPGETVELLSDPCEKMGEFARVCVKDGLIGWVPILNDEGGCRFSLSA